MTDPTLIARPWLSDDHDRLHGMEEIVGPGGFDAVGKAASTTLLQYQKAMELAYVCESPIEIELGSTLYRFLRGTELVIVPQYKWQQFRMDFAIMYEREALMFIECDGRDFHSTPEQIARDRLKDAAAKEANVLMIRVTGSQIYNNALGWAKHIASKAILMKTWVRLVQADPNLKKADVA